MFRNRHFEPSKPLVEALQMNRDVTREELKRWHAES
jgi:hypothetical protein